MQGVGMDNKTGTSRGGRGTISMPLPNFGYAYILVRV